MENLQSLRLEALRLALSRHTHRSDGIPNETVLIDADKYLNYITNGTTSRNETAFDSKIIESAYLRACNDVVSFCEYVSIWHPLKQDIPCNLYNYQIDCLRTFSKYPLTIVNSARQMGVTTMMLIYAVWLAMFQADQTILLVANSYNQAMNMINLIRFIYENLPKEFKSNLTQYSENTMVFENGSKFIARPASGHACRGLSISLVLVDNAAFISHKFANELWESLLPTLSTGGRAIIASTPNTDKGLFYRLYTDGSNNFCKITLPWNLHPGRDVSFGVTLKNQIGTAAFEREYNCGFSPFERGKTLFSDGRRAD